MLGPVDWDLTMRGLKERVVETWPEWYLEATPGIFLVGTILRCSVFGLLAFVLSFLGLLSLKQHLGPQSPIVTGTTICGPTVVVVAVIVFYRARAYRTGSGP